MKIRLSLLAALALALLLTLAACADREKVITIGTAVSETGRYAQEGTHTREGYQLWLDWVNDEAGGIDVDGVSHRVELIMYDDQSDPKTNAELVAKLIDEDEVDFLLGPYSSTLTQSAIEVADPKGVIIVEGTGSSESLFEQGFQNLFAVLTPAGKYAESALNILAGQGAETLVVAYADTLFPRSVADGVEKWAAQHGVKVLAIQPYPQDLSDVTDIVYSFKALNPDVFINAGYYNDALLFVRAAKALDFNPKATVMTVGPTDPRLIQEVGADADFLIGPTQWTPTMQYAGDRFGSAADYAERFQRKFNATPTYQSASASAAALALQLAIEAAASTNPDEVRAALRNLKADTFYGPIEFDSTGKNAAKPMGAIQIQDGQALVVAPAPIAATQIIYPTPPWQTR